MKQISVLRKIYRERGYLVTWQSYFQTPFEVGEVIDRVGGEGFNLGPMRVISTTTQRDFLIQQWLSKRIDPVHWKHCNVKAYMQEQKNRLGPITFWRVRRTKRRTARGVRTEETHE